MQLKVTKIMRQSIVKAYLKTPTGNHATSTTVDAITVTRPQSFPKKQSLYTLAALQSTLQQKQKQCPGIIQDHVLTLIVQ